MRTLKDVVETRLNRSPYLREAVGEGLVNISSLARQLAPGIAAELKKPVTVGAVTMALKRYATTLENNYFAANPGMFLGNLTLQSDLFEITVPRAKGLSERLSKLIATSSERNFFVCTQGIHETTVIAANALRPEVDAALGDITPISTYDSLTALSLQRLENHGAAIGVLQFPLRVLAWQGVSVVELVSTNNELMIVISDDDVDNAVIAIRHALKDAKNK